MAGELARPNVFEIDLRVIAGFTRQVRALIGPETFFFATLKADAYGYGVLPVARTVLSAGAQALSLASLEDAVQLRLAGIEVPIMVYAGVLPSPAAVRAIERHGLIASIYSEESLRAYEALASQPIPVAVKVEIGPERIGVAAAQAVDFIADLVRRPAFSLQVLNAHPNVPAHAGVDCLHWQYRNFVAVCEGLERRGIRVPYRVLASSRVLRMTGTGMLLNAVDPGDALFAPLHPVPGGGPTPLRALRSRLIQVRPASRREYLAEAPFPLRPGMRIGIIPMGYSDGMKRLHCGAVLVRGRRAPILGSPALEYTRIDLTGIAQAAAGDEVMIIGEQDGAAISAHEVMQAQGAARVADLAMEIRSTTQRHYVEHQ
ncbi:alanine racemase [Pigmentiphaga soli]|uniref:Alanine racemase n=2 Tax=Pigmentiphaga soli TaxID=1007095 RepID=A0ABP8GEA4_9BURK